MSLKSRLLKKEKENPIDILDLYTKKIINKDKQKEYLKKHPEIWQRKLRKKKTK